MEIIKLINGFADKPLYYRLLAIAVGLLLFVIGKLVVKKRDEELTVAPWFIWLIIILFLGSAISYAYSEESTDEVSPTISQPQLPVDTTKAIDVDIMYAFGISYKISDSSIIEALKNNMLEKNATNAIKETLDDNDYLTSIMKMKVYISIGVNQNDTLFAKYTNNYTQDESYSSAIFDISTNELIVLYSTNNAEPERLHIKNIDSLYKLSTKNLKLVIEMETDPDLQLNPKLKYPPVLRFNYKKDTLSNNDFYVSRDIKNPNIKQYIYTTRLFLWKNEDAANFDSTFNCYNALYYNVHLDIGKNY